VVIVTRNVSDFAKGAIPAILPVTCFSPIELGLPLQKQYVRKFP